MLARALEIEGAATPRLLEAMRYSTLAGGKRVRPVLVYATGEALGAPLELLDAAAAAVELIHVYSLVHDDLPAMDNDDLRRGRPTCHRAFDEATAILVGDALQARAFEVLANGAGERFPPMRGIEMLRVLADAIGTRGMAGGQAIDLEAVKQVLGEPELERMHRQKTGALIQASVLLGAISAGSAGRCRNARRSRNSARRSASPSRSRTTFSTSKAPPPRSANAPAPTRTASSRRIRRCSAWRSRATQALARRDRAIAALAPVGHAFRALREFANFLVARATDGFGLLSPRPACKLRTQCPLASKDLSRCCARSTLPADLRAQPENRLGEVCAELRDYLISSVATRGGHFAAGLGTVELTVALHYVFDTPRRPAGVGRRPPGLSAQGAHRPARPARHHQAERRARAVSVARGK